jgi:transglutaminase-like putative cysteine protease
MELTVLHQTTYRYDTPVGQIALLLRLQPSLLDGQTPRDWQVSVNGEPVPPFHANGFGDGETFFQQRRPIRELLIVASGTVTTSNRHGVVSGFRQEAPLPVFLRQTDLTRPDAAIRAFAQGVPGQKALDRLHALSARVREAISYRPGSTSMASTAAEALSQGQGVCQDHTHLFVSAARVLGIPARYVTGYLLADDASQALRETHAWAEAWVEGLGWLGFDATNSLCVTDHYVRLCCGLDAQEAAPVRGSAFGAAATTVQADVMINETRPDAAQQKQQQQ